MPKVFISSVIEASVEEVWAYLRDFNGLPQWHPVVAESSIEQGRQNDQVGCIRRIRMRDGGIVREQLLALSDLEHRYTYAIVESPLGLENYVSTLALTRITDGNQTFATWSAEFLCPPERERALLELVGQTVFHGGLSSVKAHFRRGSSPKRGGGVV